MKLSSRVVLTTSIVLAGIIIVMIVFAIFGWPWLWNHDKWADFWIATLSGVITLATIGALATYVVELLTKDLEEKHSKQQLRADCEREWSEFKENLTYLRLEELPYSHDIDYTDMATPHYATVLANFFKTLPLSRWRQGLSSKQPRTFVRSAR